MLAAVVTAVNKPWELKELPVPKPGINQGTYKIHASGLCYKAVLLSSHYVNLYL